MTAQARPLRVRVRLDSRADTSAEYLFERTCFEREYGVAPHDHDAEFAPYRDRSTMVSVVDTAERVVGSMRLIAPGPDPRSAPIKTFVEAALEPWCLDVERSIRASGMDVARTWDVATLAVDRSLGRGRAVVLGALHHSLFKIAERRDVRFLTMTVDERVRATLRMVGLVTDALPGAHPQPFCGSQASTPAWGACADMLAHQRQHFPEAHRLTTLGIGLSEVAFPGWDAPWSAPSIGVRAGAPARFMNRPEPAKLGR